MNSPVSEHSRWFADEVQPHEPALRAYLHRQFPALADVDDLVQSAYISLIRARNRGAVFEPRAYLFASARNAAVDVCRRHRHIPLETCLPEHGHQVAAEGPTAAELASRSQEIELLGAAIESLPARCRQILKLRKIDGLSYRDIADRLGISERTVNAQLAAGLVRCRRYLQRCGVGKTHDNVPRPYTSP